TRARDRDDHFLDQQADDPLAVSRRRRRDLPQRWQLPGQGPNLLTLHGRQTFGLAAAEARVLFLQPTLLLQGLFPAPLQRAGHQAVLRLDRIVLPACPLDLVTGPLQLLLPM